MEQNSIKEESSYKEEGRILFIKEVLMVVITSAVAFYCIYQAGSGS
jgi:hypothetical protein